MILILGGRGSGRHAFLSGLGLAEEDWAEVTAEDLRLFAGQGRRAAEALACRRAVIAEEQGLGIIPLEAAARRDRETNGRLNIQLAELADCVVFMTVGIPHVIKGSLPDVPGRRSFSGQVFS